MRQKQQNQDIKREWIGIAFLKLQIWKYVSFFLHNEEMVIFTFPNDIACDFIIWQLHDTFV